MTHAHRLHQSAELIVEFPFLDMPGREGLPMSLRPRDHRAGVSVTSERAPEANHAPDGGTAQPERVRELAIDLPLLPDDLAQLDRPLAGTAWRVRAEGAIASVLSVWGAPLDADEVLDLLVHHS